jgi:hypothetical protein
MTITNKAFPFATTAEGFTGNPETADCTMSYDSGVGNPAGSLKARTFGRNKTTVNNYWEWSGTWEDLGVTSGDVVTQVRLNAADNRCTEWNVGTSATIGPYAIYDSTGTTLIATLWAGRSPTASEGGWTSVGTQSYQSVASAYQASGTSIRLRLYSSMDNGNNANAAISLQDDNFSIDIDHQAGSDDLTANSISTTPVVGTPTIGQTHALTAVGITTTTTLDTPTVAIPGLIVSAVEQFVANTSSGNQDLTTTKLNGETPSCVIFTITPAVTNGTPVDDTILAVGWADESGNSQALCFNADDGVNPTDTGTRFVADPLVIANATTQAVEARGEFVSWITNGIRINWAIGEVPAAAFRINAWFLAGDITIDVGSLLMHATIGQTASVSSLSGTPHIVFGMCAVNIVDTGADDNGGHWRSSWGVAVNDGSETQRGIGAQNRNGVALSDNRSSLNTNYMIRAVANTGSSWEYGMELTSFDANGFTMTTRDGSRADTEMLYLAITLDGVRQFSLETFATKSGTTGEKASTNPGFEPESLLIGMTMAESVDTIDVTDTIGGTFGLAMADDATLISAAWQGDSGIIPSNEATIVDSKINLPNEDGTTGITATIPSGGIFQSTGFNLDFTAVETNAKQWWVLAIEVGGEDTTDNLTANSITVNSVVETPTIGQTHVLDANDISTTPEVETPTVGQSHVLDANDISTTPEVETPTLTPIAGTDNLTANSVSTTPVVETSTIGQVHALDGNSVSSSPAFTSPTIKQTHVLDANDVSTIPAVETPTVSESHVLSANDISTTSEVETPTIGQTHVLDANDISTTSEVENPVLGIIGEDNLIANSISTTPEVETPTIGQEHVLVAIDITTTSEVDTPTITHVHVLSSTSVGTTPVVDNPIASQIHNLSIIDISTTPEVGNPVLGVDGEDNLIANSISTIPVVDNSTIGQVHILVASNVSTTTIVGTPTLTSVTGVDNLIATSIITSPVVGAPSIGQEHVLDVTGIVTNSVVGTPAIGQIHTLSASDIQTTTVVGTPILSHIHVLSAVGISTFPVVDTPLIGQVHALGSTPVIVSPTLGNPVVGQIHILDSVDIVTNPVVGSPSWDLIEGPVVITFGVIYPEYSFTVILPEVDIKTPNT